MAMFRCSSPGGGGGSSVTIEYIDNIASGSGSSSKTVNFKTGTYARDDYASLTTDNFLIIPHRGSNGVSVQASASGLGYAWAYSYGHKNFSYSASTGVLTFYGGVRTELIASGTVKQSGATTANYDIYIIKPGLSQVVS